MKDPEKPAVLAFSFWQLRNTVAKGIRRKQPPNFLNRIYNFEI